jgi:hypothetical protein
MPSRHLTLRLDNDAFERLDAESKRIRQTRSELAKRLLEEGLRMEAHPGIVFRQGALERHAALADGPKVWVIARVLREMKAPLDEAVAKTAELMELSPLQVRIAARYYADFREEIDEYLRVLDEEAELAEAAFHREQSLLQR